MTGFGKAVERSPYGKFTVEIRTLNNKGLYIVHNGFAGSGQLEEKLEKMIKGNICRGKVFISVSYEPEKDGKSISGVSIDHELAKDYVQKLGALQKDLKIPGELQLSEAVKLPGVVSSSVKTSEKKIWEYVSKAAGRALERLMLYRRKEGRRTAREFRSRIEKIKRLAADIEKNQKKSVKEYRKRLSNTVEDLEKDMALTSEKMDNEVAAFARNCDIAEEINRLKGHLLEFSAAMKPSKRDNGKKLDFIAQEMQRETNTVGAKSDSFEIAKDVINIKTQIEKLREQIRNIE